MTFANDFVYFTALVPLEFKQNVRNLLNLASIYHYVLAL